MKRLIIASVLLLAPAFGFASGGDVHLEESNIDLSDKESLQRGAKSFVNYCMGCHSLQYMRYNRMGEDLGLDEVQVRQNFIFDSETKPGSLMVSAMRPEHGEKWFGTAVPDFFGVVPIKAVKKISIGLGGIRACPEVPYSFQGPFLAVPDGEELSTFYFL